MMGDYRAGLGLLEEGLVMKRALDDRWGTALGLRHLGLEAYDQSAYSDARRLLGESLTLSRAMGSPWSIAYSLNVVGAAVHAQGAYAEAQEILYEGLALSQALTDRYNTTSAKS